jgi:hypothetical protein
MPKELKDLSFSEEERSMGTKTLEAYKKASGALFAEYIAFHNKLLAKKLPHEVYMSDRKLTWNKYKADDKRLHDQFVDDCETIGYSMRAD